jgi:hypothetical protein
MQSERDDAPGPEYLPDEQAGSKPRSGGRTALLGAAAVAVAGVVGLGGWAAVSLMSTGSQPAEAVPANALGYVSLDLDPSASQKIEAIKMLRKFPALEKEMDISSQDDLRRWAFEKLQDDGTCADLDYDEDVAPWLGNRIAMAGVPGEAEGDSPMPLLALQVSDEDAASTGIDALADCGGAGDDFGYAFSGDYALITDSKEHAESIAKQVEGGTLADDADFQTWMDRVGDPGILTMYAAPGSMESLFDMQGALTGELSSLGGDPKALSRAQAEAERVNEMVKDLYKEFSGMASVVRFHDGAVEAEFASDSSSEGMGLTFSKDKHIDVTSLPAGTAAAFGLTLPENWGNAYLDLFGKLSGNPREMDQMLALAEAQTGLEIPEDLERLLGDGVAVTLDEGLDVEAASQDPAAVPAGVRISGDPQQIQAAVDKLRTFFGPQADALVVEEGDGAVALGLDADYVQRLAHEGGLGADATFQDVVPEADRAASVMYLNFDTVAQWIDQAADGGATGPDEKKVRDNIEPLRAVGFSAWLEDEDVAKGLFRLSTD